jgi:xeroderma pigmentosum group C-complementing protein
MPTSIAGFKDHPLQVLQFFNYRVFDVTHYIVTSYALARHLKREEVIHPLVELGKFRGEPVYPRGNVLSLKTAENWTRQGYRVREGCQPMKWVKQRAVTVNKKRAIEMALAERGDGSEDNIMQGLYAQSQTELYVPDPIVDVSVTYPSYT